MQKSFHLASLETLVALGQTHHSDQEQRTPLPGSRTSLGPAESTLLDSGSSQYDVALGHRVPADTNALWSAMKRSPVGHGAAGVRPRSRLERTEVPLLGKRVSSPKPVSFRGSVSGDRDGRPPGHPPRCRCGPPAARVPALYSPPPARSRCQPLERAASHWRARRTS